MDLYVGGAEHAVLHLLYARFWHKVLFDLGHVHTAEPFEQLMNQGLILAEDGQKMSKSLGNVVNPDDIVNAFGAETLRIYEMFMGPFEQAKTWNTGGVEGVRKFLDRVWRVFQKPITTDSPAPQILKVLHQTTKIVGEHIESFRFNTAVAQMMILTNELTALESVSQEVLETFAKLLSPFAPHLAEEFWQEILGHSETISYEPFPSYEASYLEEDTVSYAVQVNGKVRGDFSIAKDAPKETVFATAKSLPNVQKFLTGEVKKEVFVQGKIVGFVV